jgi:hypothetical protein
LAFLKKSILKRSIFEIFEARISTFSDRPYRGLSEDPYRGVSRRGPRRPYIRSLRGGSIGRSLRDHIEAL